MSDYSARAYRQQLESQYASVLNNPLADQGYTHNLKKAINEKVAEFIAKQQAANDQQVQALKRKML